MWCNTNSHGSNTDSLFDFVDELIASLDVSEWGVDITWSWQLLREDTGEELKQLALSLDCLLDLQRSDDGHSRAEEILTCHL